MFTAHMNNEKIAEDLIAETRSPQDSYQYATSREKGIELRKKTEQKNRSKTLQEIDWFFRKTFTTVKYDQIDKVAMDSEMINQLSQKKNYQMTNLTIH